MNMITLATAGLGFGFLFLVFRPLEMVFPAKPGQRLFRRAWLTDLCFFLGQYLLWSSVVLWLLVRFNHWVGWIVPRKRVIVLTRPWRTKAG